VPLFSNRREIFQRPPPGYEQGFRTQSPNFNSKQ
jgi:hypothetical protein